jgi:hypothetical protein
MTRLLTALIAGTALASLATAANATIITTPVQTITFNTTNTDWTQSGLINLFDSNLGTLQYVIIGDSYTETSDPISVTNSVNSNPVGTSSSGFARTDTTLTISSSVSGINNAIQTKLNGGQVEVLGQKFSFTNLGQGQTVTGTSNGSGGLTGPQDTTASDLQAFEAAGGGTANLSGTTSTSTLISFTGGNASATDTTTSGGTFTYQYAYDDSTAVPPGPAPVPEPASMALLGAGLLGAGLVRRRASK